MNAVDVDVAIRRQIKKHNQSTPWMNKIILFNVNCTAYCYFFKYISILPSIYTHALDKFNYLVKTINILVHISSNTY